MGRRRRKWRGASRGSRRAPDGGARSTARPSTSEWRAALQDNGGSARTSRPIADGDRPAQNLSGIGQIEWSISFVAFLAFTFAIVTYLIPIGNVAMAIALVALPFQHGKFRTPAPLLIFAFFVIWAAQSYFGTAYPEVVSEELWGLFKLWLIALVAVNVLRSRSQVRFFVIFFLGCFALFPARGAIANYFIYGYTEFGRAIWNNAYGNPNDLAALCFLPLAIAAGLFVTERKGWVKLGALASLFVIPLLILITQSRGAFLALVVVVGLGILAHSTFSDYRKILRLVAVGGLFAVLAIAIVPEGAWERFSGLRRATSAEALETVDEEGSAQQRFDIWRTAAAIIDDNPTRGVGIGAYHEAHFAYAALDPSFPAGRKDAHSTYLSVLAETGVPGLLIFLSLLGITFYRVERVRRRGRNLLPGAVRQVHYLELGLIGYLLAGIFGSFALLSFLYIHLALVWVLTEIVERETAMVWRATAGGESRRRDRPRRSIPTSSSGRYQHRQPREGVS